MKKKQQGSGDARDWRNKSLDAVFTSPPPEPHPDTVVAASRRAMPSNLETPSEMSSHKDEQVCFLQVDT